MKRRKNYEHDLTWLWIFLTIFFSLTIVMKKLYASDYHQSDQNHRVVYTVLNSSGIPVSDQTVNIAVERSKDGYFLDFSDNTFKASGWTTRMTTMQYDSVGEHYYRVISIDNGGIISGDYAVIISNDNATYADHQTEVVCFDSLGKLVKIHR